MKAAYLIATLTTLALTPPLAAQQEVGPPAREMKQRHMQQRMDSLDARLDSLVTRMNQARGDQKITAMAAVINELVAQRRMMRRHMHEMMERRRMHHGMHDMKDSSSAVPSAAPRPAPGDTTDHAEHHPEP